MFKLGKSNPALDTVKILELNSYLCYNKPSIVILNETWLTGSIDDPEIISKDQYIKSSVKTVLKEHTPLIQITRKSLETMVEVSL